MTHNSTPDQRILTLDLACYHAVHDHPGGVAAVAAVFGWAESTLQNKLNPTQTRNKLTAFEAENILQLTKDPRILDAVCHPAGAIWLQGDKFEGFGGDMAMLDNITDLVKKVGDLSGTVQQSLSDGVVTPDEMAQLEHALFRLVQSGHAVLKRAEEFTE